MRSALGDPTTGRRGFVAETMLILVVAVAGLALPRTASALVYLNELTVRPVGVSEQVELYNAGPDSVDVGGWTIRGSKGAFVIPAPAVIPPDGYYTADVGDIQGEYGGVTSLIDLVPGLLPAGRDSVHYGQEGSAPLPPEGTSLARAPDASLAPPPAPDPDADGLVWTIDFSPTFGSMNDAPPPEMGEGLRLNEIGFELSGGRVEIFDPFGAGEDLAEWILVDGASVKLLGGLVPPGGFAVVPAGPELDLTDTGLLYLFRPDATRVDQLGFHDAPSLEEDECLGRCPDGAPPFLGYTFGTSGGGTSFLLLDCSLGASNACAPTPVREMRWGRLKAVYR